MIIYPDIYPDFECVGKACLGTCCAGGWQIPLDKKTGSVYEKLEGNFGRFVRENIENKGQENYVIRMKEDGRCPFLNEENLCEIFIQCGGEYMGATCQAFPRRNCYSEACKCMTLSLSCEEVFRILYDKKEPVSLSMEGTVLELGEDDQGMYELIQFMYWGCDLLYSKEFSYGMELGALAYLGVQAADCYVKLDFLGITKELGNVHEVMNQFRQIKEEFSREELDEIVCEVVSAICESFAYALRQDRQKINADFVEKFSFWKCEKEERREKIFRWCREKDRIPEHDLFMRNIAAAYFIFCAMEMGIKDADDIFVAKWCNFVLLMHMMFLAWKEEENITEKEYFKYAAQVSRIFDHSKVIEEFVYPLIKQQLNVDVLTYALIFSVMFDPA